MSRTEQPSPNTTRIFVAAPMSAFASDADYAQHRYVVNWLCARLEQDDGVSVYFAGRAIDGAAGFDDPKKAFLADFDALVKCDLFVLYYPAPVRSSVLVELGIAIGRGKPSLLLPARRKDLVFLLQQAENKSGHGEIPPIIVREFGEQGPSVERLAGFVGEAMELFGLSRPKPAHA
jgi:hypothetical protein